ncbi:hypothetical protein EDB19DRAFT_1830916 [Suillus lakei]|nr:hypothetical protein EDB19DRAFT_1830916 [Suillus lakei]
MWKNTKSIWDMLCLSYLSKGLTKDVMKSSRAKWTGMLWDTNRLMVKMGIMISSNELGKLLQIFLDPEAEYTSSEGYLQLLATRNPGLVPESLKEALSGYSLEHHRKRNVARSEKQTIAKALGLHATPLTAQSLAATGIIKVVICDHSDDTSLKWGTLLVDLWQ